MTSDTDYSIPPAAWESRELLQAAIDAIVDPIFVKDTQHRWVVFNQAFAKILSKPRDELLGRSDADYLHSEQYQLFWADDDHVIASGQPSKTDELLTFADGTLLTVWTRKFPLYDAQGKIIGLCAVITDITDMRQREQRVEQLEAALNEQLALIENQKSLLDQLAVPVIQVWKGVLLLPLVGAIDDRRAERITESLLEAITKASAEYVLLDMTGVPVVDTSVASYIVRAVRAAQLLGCRSMMVGISAEIAQTLVSLGVDFSSITTLATLQQGLEYALTSLNYTFQHDAATI